MFMESPLSCRRLPFAKILAPFGFFYQLLFTDRRGKNTESPRRISGGGGRRLILSDQADTARIISSSQHQYSLVIWIRL
jgi:hypothetical protein